MKQLSLKDVMFRQRLIILGDGFCIENSAGSANYDKFGKRTTVRGIPEYFPLSLIIDNNTAATPVSVGETHLSSPCHCSKGEQSANNITIKLQLDVTPALEQLESLKSAIESSLKSTGLHRVV